MTAWLHLQGTPSSGQQVIFETQMLSELTMSSKPGDVHPRNHCKRKEGREGEERKGALQSLNYQMNGSYIVML